LQVDDVKMEERRSRPDIARSRHCYHYETLILDTVAKDKGFREFPRFFAKIDLSRISVFYRMQKSWNF